MAKAPAREKVLKKKACAFCKDDKKAKKDGSSTGAVIDYKDTALLRKFVSDRGKIRARRVTGNCVQHQRDIAVAVKNSREVALLPYVSTAR
ncbi:MULTISPECIES: 30S ribosomal protein S18 [Nocardia]|uniref:Small ribosomal subunit protein bS18 n=2 Tax=Nocardia TaxID=1817 RepID=A0A2T2Z544_9NOCA|nr:MULTISPECIES: 30S ribosomal protein S18 [Nocardia]MBF6244919.1 30S ribosomal protein S18 [Nocardia elegans]MBF6449819.1 30S ribosomal protein S18 [Nocardia elegans]PSR62865.1 30S ribosomal protein S18 [Nocardia nova]